MLGSIGFGRRYLEDSLEVCRLAPVWIGGLVNAVAAHMMADQDEDAGKLIDLGLQLGLGPNVAPVADMMSQLAMRGGRHHEAAETIVAALPPAFTGNGGGETVHRLFRAAHDGTGIDAAVAALDALRARVAPAEMTQFMRRRFMIWYAMLGSPDQAFELAGESLDQFARSGTIGSAWTFLWMREMRPFRLDARFQPVCRRMGMFDYWHRHGAPDNCELRGDTLICS